MRPWEDKIRKVTPYTPGEQPKCGQMIKLNTNENPYPPSEAVIAAIKTFDFDTLRLYPDPTMQKLIHALAQYHDVQDNMVFAGVGSDDVLATAFMTFFNSERPILFPDITYSFYNVWADLFGIPYDRPALDEAFRIRPQDYEKQNGGVILPNPNAPTSVYAPLSQIEAIIQSNQDVIVIIDEAYIDFGGESALKLIDRYENLLVVRTYSKSRSMAGMRIGYAIGSPVLIKALNDVKYSFNSYTLNQISLLYGVASLQDETYFIDTVQKIIATREWSKEELRKLGFVFEEPMANFIFAMHPNYSAKELMELLRSHTIFVRHFNAPRIENYLRITIGTDEEMKQLISVLQSYLD